MPRVRATNPTIAALVTQAEEQSPTFRSIVDIINGTDGLVYVENGKCPGGSRACLMHSVTIAGPNRLLRVKVDVPRSRSDRDLIALLGHELRHAVEILSNPGLRNNAEVLTFYQQEGGVFSGGRFVETEAAVQAQLKISDELTGRAPSTSHVRPSDPKIAVLIKTGMSQSATFRELVGTLDRSDVIVYIEPKTTRENELGGYLSHSVVSTGGYRYLRIAVEVRGAEGHLLPLLAHELQHAVEVAEDTEVRDTRSLEQLFKRLAISDGCARTTCSESNAAIDVQTKVSAELKAAHQGHLQTQVPSGGGSGKARVRSEDRVLAGLISRASLGSVTFRHLLNTLESTDGVVYIEAGRCSHGVRACLQMWMHAAGGNRFLRVRIDRKREDSDLDVMASIGHELQHTIEGLSDVTVVNGTMLYNFFRRYAPTDSNRFETTSAVAIGDAIREELQASKSPVDVQRMIGDELSAVLSTQSETAADVRTMAAARKLAGLSTTTIPITLVPDAPAGTSRRIEGWTRFNSDGKGLGVFVYARSATFRCAVRSAETTTCLFQLASILVHEVWHFEHGFEEDGAYGAQIDFLNKVGVPTRIVREVMAAHAAAVRADRNRIQIHREISEAQSASVDHLRFTPERSLEK
jgi:hypothetical protein